MDTETTEIIDALTEITKLQAEIIDQLFYTLSRYASMDDLKDLPVIANIKDVSLMLEELREVEK